MRTLWLILFLCGAAGAQTPAAPFPEAPVPPASPKTAVTPPTTVVARIAGKDYTAGDIEKLLDKYPPVIRSAFAKKPKETLTSLFLIQYLAEQAREHHLDQQEGFQQSAEWASLLALSQAQLSYYHDSYRPPNADERAYYDKYPEKWERAEFQEIEIYFSPAPAPAGRRNEAEAKALAEELKKKIDAGGDFGALAKQYSENKATAGKGGEHPVLERTGPYPEGLKKALFAMKPGEVSEPLKQSGAYYLLKLHEITKQPFNEVESRIYRDLQQEHFSAYVKKTDEENRITVVNPKFFANSDAH